MSKPIIKLLFPAILVVFIYSSFLNYEKSVYEKNLIVSFDNPPKNTQLSKEEDLIEEVDQDSSLNKISTSTENLQTKKIENKKATTTETTITITNFIPDRNEVVLKTRADFTKINENTRSSLVNILCSTKTDGILSPITGSGILISKNGLILTNAHIAQYFLLKDFGGVKDFIDCIIRTGSPAYPTYKAKLVYLSPDWVMNNKTLLIEKNPKGTGEFDYGFLKITSKIDGSVFSETPFLPVSTDEITESGADVLVASYPAGFLGGIAILQYLYQGSSETKISDIYTFKQNTVDLISVGGTVVSQKGSSGGGVVSDKGSLLGIISTSGDADRTKDRDLRAITTAYINRDFKEKTGFSLDNIISNSEPIEILFAQKREDLIKILTDAILN